MTKYKTRRMKREVMRLMHLTRPPRMEGAAKEAMMQPVRKSKVSRQKSRRARKMQGSTQRQRKDYQLPTRSGRR